MTYYVFSCLQYLEDNEGNTIAEGVFMRTMIYDHPTSKREATKGFIVKHTESKYGKAGWKLTGGATILKIDPKMIEEFSHCIDDGLEDEEVPPANENSHLKIVR
ncbi:hypothetical protein K2P47_01915 [Patescibacteria group bacterium]|nr:hypothetical protein [Patescibacteria group bacterium]